MYMSSQLIHFLSGKTYSKPVLSRGPDLTFEYFEQHKQNSTSSYFLKVLVQLSDIDISQKNKAVSMI